MDGNNWRSANQAQAQSETPSMDSEDWRTQLPPDSRQKIVGKIMDTLRKHLPFTEQEGMHELNKIAVRFEDKIFTAATSQPDYLRKISLKMLSMEAKSQNPTMDNSVPSANHGQNTLDPGSQNMQFQAHNQGQSFSIPVANNDSQQRSQLSQNNATSSGVQGSLMPPVSCSIQNVGQNSNLQSISGISQNSLGNSIGQGLAPNMFSNPQRQIPGRQQQQQQTQNTPQQYIYSQPQQLLKPKLQPGNMSQSYIQSHHQQLQPIQSQQSLMQPSSVPHSSLQTNKQSSVQQSTQSALQQHPQSLLRQQHQNTANMQLNPLFVQQQNNVSEIHPQQQYQQWLPSQQNTVGNLQQSMTQQNNQQFISSQSGNSMQSGHTMLQQSKAQQQIHQGTSSLLPNQIQSSQQLISQQPLSMQHQQQCLLQRDLQSRNPTSGVIQKQNVVGQQKQQIFQSQRNPEVSSTSLDSTAQTQTDNSSMCDWQDDTYQKIKSMRDANLPELVEFYQKLSSKFPQPEAFSEQQKTLQNFDKLRTFKELFEQSISFLRVPRNGITPGHRDKLPNIERQVASLVNMVRSRKSVSAPQQGQLPPSHLQSIQQAPPGHLQQVQSHENQINSQMQNNITGMQHGVASFSGVQTVQPKMMNSFHHVPNMESGLGNAPGSLQQVSIQQNSSLTSPNGMNLVQTNLSNSSMLQNQNLRQQQAGQMSQAQPFKQQFQSRQNQIQDQIWHKQMQHSQHAKNSAQVQAHQLSQLQQMSDANDLKMKPGMTAKPGGIFEQHPLTANQRSAYHHQQLKAGSFPSSSPQLLPDVPPQISQHDQSNVLSNTKNGPPFQIANSSYFDPSPPTPVVPSPVPGDSEKHNTIPSTNQNSVNIGHQQGSSTVTAAQSLAIGTPGISASPLLAEFSSPDGNQKDISITISGKSSLTEQPLERLLKAVKSLSPEALCSSVRDIGSVVSMIDSVAGSAPGNGSRAAVGEDLVAMTKCRLQARNIASQDGTSGFRKMRRNMTAMPLNVTSSAGSVNDSFKQFTGADISDLDSTATSSIKRPRVEANHALSEEIKQINQRLIDTVVEISDEDFDSNSSVAGATNWSEGTIVKCCFIAVALSPNLKSQYSSSAHTSPIQTIRLFVPTNYPSCSPVLLDKLPVEISKENDHLSTKARARFSIALCGLSQPMSIGDIARTWDTCARGVVSDYAQQNGGGTFSSKYGTWEICSTAP